jgi:hypothetical protein
MLKKILAPALGALAIAAIATGAPAQFDAPPPPPQAPQPQYGQPQPQYPQQQYPQQQQYQPQYSPGGQQASPACVRLEAQLASLSGPNTVDPQQQAIENAYNQQRQELERMTARSRGMGCGRNFLFGPRPPPECRGLQNQIDRMEDQVDRLQSQIKRGRGNDGLNEARKRDLIAALAHHRCGPQYEAQVQQQDRGGLFGFLFGNRIREAAPGAPTEGYSIPSGTYRTVCVRTCDGFFFPVSYATVPARFGQDENMCKRTCPGTEAMLFSYPTGGSIEQGSATNGTPYTSLPNAFKYQTEFVKDCSCKPAGKTWEQALTGVDDDTLQRGDIVVDEDRAKAMSQPPVGGAPASPAPQDAAPAQEVIENPANTELPPGYQPDPNAQIAEPYYVPPPPSSPPPQQPLQQRPEPKYVPPQFR